MKLFKVRTVTELYSVVLAENEEDAKSVASYNFIEIAREMDLNFEFNWDAEELKELKDLPKPWESYCIPYSHDDVNKEEFNVGYFFSLK